MAFNKNTLVVGALASSLIITGCTGKDKTRIVKEKQAPVAMAESFSKPQEDVCALASCITIQKASLKKVFLLIASGATGGSTPQWYDLKPQVVTFERSGGRIAILGQNYNSIYEEIPSQNLIQSFAIVKEDDSSITFDWGKGLETFISENPYDVDGPRGMNGDLTETSESSIPVKDTLSVNIKFDADNIELQQKSKVMSAVVKQGDSKDSLSIENREETILMNVQIRAYRLESNFKPKSYDASRRVGFFVAKRSKPKYSKDVVNLITKWDLSPERGPVRIRISKTVPADYLQAVVEGALYWNKVFGRDVVKVETGVDPKDASPQDRSIMIRWIDWLDAGAAYAISQSDPLTGEILRAQVFMPSVFTSVGSADLTDLNGKAPVVVNGAIACDFSQAAKDLAKLTREASDSQRLRLAQDSVRSTVAHELGHAFGLRHNFAGSSSAKVSLKDIQDISKTYLKDPNSQGLETSTSIMDYVSGVDNILMAARIKYAPLSYDKMAMDWAYSDNNDGLSETVSRYCTDDDIALANAQGMNVYGCERFDAGNNPLQRKVQDALDEKGNLVNVLFASIIGRMYPANSDSVANLDSVLKDTVKWGKADLSPLTFAAQFLLDWQKDGSPSNMFASLDSVKTGKVLYSKFGMDEALKRARVKDLADAGGYVTILNGLLRNSAGEIETNWFDRQVDVLEASGYLAGGKTLGGRQYSLSAAEQKKIISFFRQIAALNKKIVFDSVGILLPRINEAVKADDGTVANVTTTLPNGVMTDDQAQTLTKLVLDLLAATDGTTAAILKGRDGSSVNLPARYLSATDRKTVLKLLSTKGLNFAMDLQKANVKAQMIAGVNDVLKTVSDNDWNLLDDDQKKTLTQDLVNSGAITADVKTWLDSEIAVLTAIDSVK